ncbi:MAG: hypothetical protein Q8R88_07255 [Desulfoprunum sp.]|nr:hypothetical protein [Desulfoprunum sp.]
MERLAAVNFFFPIIDNRISTIAARYEAVMKAIAWRLSAAGNHVNLTADSLFAILKGGTEISDGFQGGFNIHRRYEFFSVMYLISLCGSDILFLCDEAKKGN